MLSKPNREGYEFVGWYKDAAFTTPITAVNETDLDENGNIVIFAKWSSVKDPKGGLSGGAIAGIVIGSVFVVGISGFVIFWFVIKKKKFADLVGVFKKAPKA